MTIRAGRTQLLRPTRATSTVLDGARHASTATTDATGSVTANGCTLLICYYFLLLYCCAALLCVLLAAGYWVPWVPAFIAGNDQLL